MDTATAALTLAGFKKGIELTVSSAPAALSAKLKEWRSKRALQEAATLLHQVRMVKTIWQIDKPVDLTDFYCPPKLLVDTRRIGITRLSDFPCDGQIVVQGTVGQGKSIFIRRLVISEAIDGERLPIFTELRRLQVGQSLMGHIVIELTALGLNADEDVAKYLMDSGRLTFFLDAFDEVREDRKEGLIQEIEHLIRAHASCRFVVTARPGSGIEQSTLFTVFELSPLIENEYEAVIRRIALDSETANAIVNGLKVSGQSIIYLLTTPLMVALLVLRHRADQSIPETYSAFFSDLFMLLIQRHDKMKAGYVRQRRANVGDRALESVFTAICFMTRKTGETAFSGPAIYKTTKEALATEGIVASADDVLHDICTITCLLLEEGGEYRFIHKVVQEYHAACFVVRQADSIAATFYGAMLQQSRGINWTFWREELAFLEIVDTYRCSKYFVIPKFESFFVRDLGAGADAPIYGLLERWLLSCRFRRGTAKAESGYDIGFTVQPSWAIQRAIVGVEHVRRLINTIRDTPGGGESVLNYMLSRRPSVRMVSLAELERNGIFANEILSVGRALMQVLQDDFEKVRQTTEIMEARQSLMEF